MVSKIGKFVGFLYEIKTIINNWKVLSYRFKLMNLF
jgi:hypothetical protein